jgi:DNA-binding NarL/FixJ family response regulator
MSVRILLADDQEMVRRNLASILKAQSDLQVVGEAGNGLQALQLASRLRPDVVLADIRMPHLDGLELTKRLAGPDAEAPCRVVVVTTFDLDEYVYAALRNGACGFILKRSGPTLLVEAVRAAMAGDALISPSITVRLLRHLGSLRSERSQKGTEVLSAREREVARLVATGKTNIEIGEDLFVSPGTIKTHIASIQRKFGARNRVGIATWAWGGR